MWADSWASMTSGSLAIYISSTLEVKLVVAYPHLPSFAALPTLATLSLPLALPYPHTHSHPKPPQPQPLPPPDMWFCQK